MAARTPSPSAPASWSVRRHWGAFRTPWVLRKALRRPGAAPLLAAVSFSGGDPSVFACALVEQTDRFSRPIPLDALIGPHPKTRGEKIKVTIDALDNVGNLIPGGGGHSGGGGGGGGLDLTPDWLDAGDEFGLILLGILFALFVIFVALPLGLLAIEVVIALVVLVAGVSARMLRLKPWTVLIRRNKQVVAAVSVRGWRSSRALICALREAI